MKKGGAATVSGRTCSEYPLLRAQISRGTEYPAKWPCPVLAAITLSHFGVAERQNRPVLFGKCATCATANHQPRTQDDKNQAT